MKQQNLPLTTANISVAQPVGIMRLETHQIGFGRFSILFLCSLEKKKDLRDYKDFQLIFNKTSWKQNK